MPNPAAPIFQVSDLHASYGPRKVLQGIHFKISAGEIVVILGGSGSGKSTLLKHMLRLEEPTQGRVEYGGKTLTDLDEPELESARLGIGFLFQHGALLGSLTVFENVAMPLEMHSDLPAPVIERLVNRRLAQLGLGDAGDRLPAQLSGGMRKRAALARALILEPPLLVCDEPSAGLDPVTSRALDTLLLDIRRTHGTTLIVVTHELDSIRRIADRILFLEGGRKIFDGPLGQAEDSTTPALHAFFSSAGPLEESA